jgi:hypothetical protein
MDSDRRRNIERPCPTARDHPTGERGAFLAEACAADEALRREVGTLLDVPPTAEGVFAARTVALGAEPHAA